MNVTSLEKDVNKMTSNYSHVACNDVVFVAVLADDNDDDDDDNEYSGRGESSR